MLTEANGFTTASNLNTVVTRHKPGHASTRSSASGLGSKNTTVSKRSSLSMPWWSM